jgi:hypothetical protein
MRPEPTAILTPEEFASLREVGRGFMIPDAHRKKFIYLYYIAERHSGLELTELGRMRLAEGR